MSNRFLTLSSLLLAALCVQSTAQGAIITLKNGDRITGRILAEQDGTITVETQSMGVVTVAALDATVERTADDAVPVDAAKAAAKTETKAEEAQSVAEDKVAAQEIEEAGAFDSAMIRARQWVQQWVPAGWSGRFHLGYQYTQTSSKTTAWNAGVRANKESGDNHYSLSAFYDYKTSTNSAGVEDKQLDKWGAEFKYRRDFGGDNFFFLANSAYLRDNVKDIRNQVTQDLGVGYYFIKNDTTTLYIAPAFTPQYKDAVGVSKKWYFLVTVLQEFKYKLNDTVTFEQTAQGSIEPQNTDNYNYKATGAIITKLTDWIDLILSYSYSYDNAVGAGGSKKEQIVNISLGIPF